MIHNLFFNPFPLQAVINALREHTSAEKLVITRIYKVSNFKNKPVNINLFESEVTIGHDTSKIIVCLHYDKIYFIDGSIRKLFKDNYFIHVTKTIDINGAPVDITKLIPRFVKLKRNEAHYLLCNVTDYTEYFADKLARCNDDEFISYRILAEFDIGWKYDINIARGEAYHVISLRHKDE